MNVYRSIFSTSMDMLFISDFDGNISEINTAGIRLLGYESAEEIIGKSIRDFYFDKSLRSDFLEMLREKKEIHDFELILVKRNGEKIICLEDAVLLCESNEEENRYHGHIKDITARVESEKLVWRKNIELASAIRSLKIHRRRLQASKEWIGFAWWEIDAETGAIVFDEEKLRMLGYNKDGRQFSHYRDFISLVHPDDKMRVEAAYGKLLSGEKNEIDETYKIKTGEGDYKLIRDRGEKMNQLQTKRETTGRFHGISREINKK